MERWYITPHALRGKTRWLVISGWPYGSRRPRQASKKRENELSSGFQNTLIIDVARFSKHIHPGVSQDAVKQSLKKLAKADSATWISTSFFSVRSDLSCLLETRNY